MKKYQLAFLMTIVVLFGCIKVSEAAEVSTGTVTITGLFESSEYGGGDVVFTVSTPITGCSSGFWLRVTDAGFKNLYAQALVSYTSKLPLRVWGYTDQLWTGSGGAYCRVSTLGPM